MAEEQKNPLIPEETTMKMAREEKQVSIDRAEEFIEGTIIRPEKTMENIGNALRGNQPDVLLQTLTGFIDVGENNQDPEKRRRAKALSQVYAAAIAQRLLKQNR